MNVTLSETESVMLRALDLMFDGTDTVEIRIPEAEGRKGRVDSGYFSDKERLVKEAAKRDGKSGAIYISLNPVDPACKARADSRLKEWASPTTADKDITRRRNLLIDFDPVRPAGISSTDEEHSRALDRARAVREAQRADGWADPLFGDSGNGAHLVYAINLPNDEASTELVKRLLATLADRFDDATVRIDRTVFNASRIVKLYGTQVRKGDSTADRPHRRSALIDVPEQYRAVTREQLTAFAGEPKTPQAVAQVHPSQNGYSKDTQAIKAAFTGARMVDYAAAHFGQVQNEGREVRILGNSGMHIDPERGIFAIGGQPGVGGDCFDEAGYKLYRDTWNRNDPDMFKAALREAGAFVGIAVAEHTKKSGRPRKSAAPITPPSGFAMTDTGNAERLISRHGQDLRFCNAWGIWLVWDGRRWKTDQDGEIMRRAIDTARSIYAEAALSTELTERTAIAKHAIRSENAARLAAMISIAQNLAGIGVQPEQLDSNPWLLNCQNGTLDLKTGTLQPAQRADLITKLVPVAFARDATCPTWDKFLAHLMNGRAGLVDFLRRAIGYSLTGDTSEQVLFLLHGLGSNGKSTLLEMLGALFGDLAQTADMNSFLHRDGEGPRNDLAKLVGARFVSAVEVKAGKRLDETLVKQLTGGDRISTRFLFKEFFDYTPRFKMWWATNHKPVIHGTDHAIWRRIRLIPFDVTIADGEKDKRLGEKLRAELAGVLAWAVRGCVDWQANGLQEPPEVLAATENYRDEMDILGGFITEKCMKNPLFHAKSSDLYHAYQQWCDENGETPVSQRKFGQTLSERGFSRVRATGGAYKYQGIGLRSSEPLQASEPSSEPSEHGVLAASADIPLQSSEPSEPNSGKVSKKFFHEGTLPKKGSLGSLGSLPDKPQNHGEQLYCKQQATPAGDKRDDWYQSLSAGDKEELGEYQAALRKKQAVN